ncbi:MAG: NFACT RNA binding domain-containing protein [Erysipelotrichaceae bacterium]|nr:NFACT RNA binding domain-containing protein [Erysipelotrichaceae bacterium]
MALDGIILSKVKEDFEKYLPIRINRIMQTSKTEIVFNVHANQIRTNLVMNFHSNFNHICFSDKSFSTYSEPSTFVMVLRKYILNGIIDSIEQKEYDRLLLLHLHARNEFYDVKHYTLSIELMGKYANIILIDEEGKIIDALKKIPPYENTRRTILPGAVFTLPESQNKKDPFITDDIDFEESLVKQLQGFSKTLEKEVRHRLNNQTYKEIINDIKTSDKLYLSRIDNTYEYHIIPLTHLSDTYEEYDIQKGFDQIYNEDDEKERIKSISDDLFKIVKRQIKHYETKTEKLNASLDDALNLDFYKNCGDLLYTCENLEEKGLKEIELEDYEGNRQKISLDPKLSIKQNANKYYANYQKKRKGKSFIEEQIEIANNELEYFRSLYEQLSYANYTDALDIKEELGRYGFLKKYSNKNINKKKKVNLYQVKVDGYTITFGKNNLQNSYLTFEYARSNYLWFHVKQYHGCHLVVDADEVPEKILRICANLAAYYSAGRYSSSVPVDYTLVKNVRKVKGAKPGFVTFKNYKTLYIDPEEDKSLTVVSI